MDSPDTPMEAEEELPDPWTLFTDGSSCVDGSRAGLILTDSEGAEFTYALRFRFEATNNEAEYEALIAGIYAAHAPPEQVSVVVEGNYRQGILWHRQCPRGCKGKTKSGSSGLPAGPFPEGPDKFKFLTVAMDYFTKWIEAKPVATITETTHSKIGVKNYASASALLPSNTHKLMVWWKRSKQKLEEKENKSTE
ncbi:reverse transcriptase domain-containing protein [Tanacetum coccineum]|uniref:Reverse transcriptase domain-containing protein n=1 Tax=Tanacetum coccineum TaxID=301880 RepID=A0ABQ5EZU9_9ASTR